MTVPVTVVHETPPVATMAAALVLGLAVELVVGLVAEDDELDEHADVPDASASTTADPTIARARPKLGLDLIGPVSCRSEAED